jgi:hypothetical protein
MKIASSTCPHCGHKIAKYPHTLSKMLIEALVKLEKHPGQNLIHIGITHNQINNFSKLQYWGFVRKTKDAGYWAITETGKDFLQGKLQVYKTVWTLRGSVDRFDGDLVRVYNIIQCDWIKRNQYAVMREEMPRQELPQGKLF